MPSRLDDIDLKILKELQDDGRITNVEVARRVGISAPPCLRRVRALEEAGYGVIVADPNFAPMYGEVQRKVKTDRRDVAALAEANRQGWYRPAYRTSAPQRALRQVLRARRQLVSMRSGTICVIRALLRQDGYRLPPGDRGHVPARLARSARRSCVSRCSMSRANAQQM